MVGLHSFYGSVFAQLQFHHCDVFRCGNFKFALSFLEINRSPVQDCHLSPFLYDLDFCLHPTYMGLKKSIPGDAELLYQHLLHLLWYTIYQFLCHQPNQVRVNLSYQFFVVLLMIGKDVVYLSGEVLIHQEFLVDPIYLLMPLNQFLIHY